MLLIIVVHIVFVYLHAADYPSVAVASAEFQECIPVDVRVELQAAPAQ